MSAETNTSQTPVPRRFRFSIGTLLLWIAIGALTMNTIIMSRQVTQLKQELTSQQPLSPKEVARQFEKSTTLGPITTTVKDVRYSSEADAYRVNFSWADSASGKTWHSDLRLNHDGFGVYSGQIRNGPFIQPLGYKEAFPIAVERPSSFDN
ncbi:hypothetical protein SH528x_002967 [Novipirellula sp. SH528]|uniref:hypothetical protein n=1 Tax=Novipirellula sp. SH528 TaxID=3454466 RepID=UPI003FA1968B